MSLWRDCGKGFVPISLASSRLMSDVYLCCPGPSLANITTEMFNVPGVFSVALNTAYPKIRPAVWIGMDKPACYDPKIWWESFVKICRGSYTEEWCSGSSIRYCPNTYFADVEDTDILDMYARRAHDTKFVWNKNSFITALHILIWMGAKRIHLVGCDFGGTSDYYDDRVLSDTLRESNRKLYSQLVERLRLIYNNRSRNRMEIISCTPNSPINEYMPYIPIDEALAKSQSRVPQPMVTEVLHAVDASLCSWKSKPKNDYGVMVGCPFDQSDLLPWWFKNYRKHNSYPVTVADFGISEEVKEACKRYCDFVDMTDIPVTGWLRKPFAILRAQAKNILWCDVDVEVRGNMGDFFKLSSGGRVAVGEDLYWSPEHYYSPAFKSGKYDFRRYLPKDCRIYDSGVLAVEMGNPIIENWACETLLNPIKYESDTEILALFLYNNSDKLSVIPKTEHLMRLEHCPGNKDNLLTFHWTGPQGKRLIREQIKERE